MPRMDPSLSEGEVQWINSQSTGKYKIMESLAEKPEKMSFWNDAPPFHSSADIDCMMDPVNKFVIEKVEARGRTKILHGARQAAVVSGMFSESEFRAGQRVTVFPCLCCLEVCSGGSGNRSEDDPDLCSMSSSVMSADTVFYVDDDHNVIMVEDDVLTVTSLCSALECINRPLMSSMVADLSFDYAHPSLVLGIVIHEILQTCLMSRKSSFAHVIKEAKRIIGSKPALLYSCNVSEREILNEVLKHMRHVMKFLEAGLAVDSIEHKVCSLHYGLKGSIDCLDASSVIEIKTGKCMRVEHRSQAILYSMLMTEQHLRKEKEDYNGFLCSIGSSLANSSTMPCLGKIQKFLPILYYVKSGDVLKIDVSHQEMVHLLRLRNDLACIKELRPCQCPEDRPCTVLGRIGELDAGHFLRRQLEAIEAEGRHKRTFLRGVKIEQMSERAVYRVHGQIAPGDHISISTEGCKVVCLGIVESTDGERVTILLRESIDLGRVIMISLDSDTTFLKFMRWSLIHIAYAKYLRSSARGKGVDSFFLPGQEFGLEHMRDEKQMPRQEHESTDSLSRFDLSGILGSEDLSVSSEISSIDLTVSMDEVPVSVLDSREHCTDCTVSSMSTIEACFSNTESDCEDSSCAAGPTVSSNAISDRSGLSAPTSMHSSAAPRPKIAFNHPDQAQHYFAPNASFQSHRYSIPEMFRSDFLGLNEDQRSALFLALNCENYRIIHGMPGTGKSTLISLLIRILAHYGMKILLICYTHMAIENILKKVGDISHYRAKRENLGSHTYESLKKLMEGPDLVAGTCYSFSDPIYIGRRFDGFLLLIRRKIFLSECLSFHIMGKNQALDMLLAKHR